MSADLSLPLRRAVVDFLKTTSVSAMVGGRIYGTQPPALPTLPFIRMGLPTPAAYEAQGWSGSESDFVVHVFTKSDGDALVSEIAAEVVEVLSGFVMSGSLAANAFDWNRTEVVRDSDEASAYHAIVTFDATVVAVAA